MQFFIADIRKRLNADASMTPHAVPEARTFTPPAPDADKASPDAKNYHLLLASFTQFAPDTPDEPVPCPLPGCEDITLEWTADASEGQIDFSAPASSGDGEPECFLTLHILSGLHPEDDRRIMKRLETYADFAQCLNFPLVLTVVQDPLPDAGHHKRLQALRPAYTAIAASFLKAYFAAAAPTAA